MPHSEVYNGDCIDMMTRYPDGFFNLAVVDPPYGIGASDWDSNESMFRSTKKWKGARKSGYKIKGWDVSPPPALYFTELFRVSKHQIIWGAHHFISLMPRDSPAWIVWDKKTTGNFSDCELAWSSLGGSVKKFEFLWNGFRKQSPEQRIHPTQKPVALYAWLLKNYAKPGDRILDTHMGSQSSRIAAYKMGFDYYGAELDPDYFKEGCERFEKAIVEPLFNDPKPKYNQQKLL